MWGILPKKWGVCTHIIEDARYDRDMFMNEIVGARSINSSITQGLGSGMINRLDWELAPYYYSNLSRGNAVSKGVPKSIQIQETNMSKFVPYHNFLEYEREVSVDVLTGQFMF